MDSIHKQVHVFWPDDSDAFSLKGDKRMIDILVVTDHLIGNNVDIPRAIYDWILAEKAWSANTILQKRKLIIIFRYLTLP